MNLITLDFETYYDKEYSLSRMSMEDYVTDPRFEIIMVGIKVNDGVTQWHSFAQLSDYRHLFETLSLADSAMLCHNTLFDGLILQHHFGIVPAMLLDTLGLAQAVLKPYHRSISLDSCLKHTEAPMKKKGYLANMIGRRRATLSAIELEKFGDYCNTDVDGTYWLFKRLAKSVPRTELAIIDMTLRMYLEPKFGLDTVVLRGVLDDTREQKRKLMEALPPEIKKTQLSSNPQFAQLLESLGVEVPMKISPTTDKPTYAFAKNDTGWKELEDEYMDDPIVGPILAARLGVKSTIAETRAERFLTIGENHGHLRVPLRYYAAHTGRYGGMEKINCQNLTRINPKNPSRNQLRYGLVAPPGFSVLACDLSQIEARINAWLAGCQELVQVFRDRGDPYCAFASKVYGREIIKGRDNHERFIGKTCIAENELVLTDRGLVPIQNVEPCDKLWDGVEWVSHNGVLYQGLKEVITYEGLTATKDHQVIAEDGRAIPFGQAASEMVRLKRSGDGGQAIRLIGDYIADHPEAERVQIRQSEVPRKWDREVGVLRQPESRSNDLVSEKRSEAASPCEGPRQSLRCGEGPLLEQEKPGISMLRRAGHRVAVRFKDAIYRVGVGELAARVLQACRNRPYRQRWALRTGEFAFGYSGAAGTEQAHQCDGRVSGGKDSAYGTTGQMHIQHNTPTTQKRDDRGADCRKIRVYDIVDAGPRHRYTVSGTLVYNCILGLGYGMGHKKLRATLRAQGVKEDAATVERYVDVYRGSYHEIPSLWRFCDQTIEAMAAGARRLIGPCTADGNVVLLPNGMSLDYPNLRYVENKKYSGWTYDFAGQGRTLWGGKFTENLVQSLARIVLMEQMIAIRDTLGLKPVLNIHDELVYIVPTSQVAALAQKIENLMRVPPSFAPDLPVDAEAAYGPTLGDCK